MAKRKAKIDFIKGPFMWSAVLTDENGCRCYQILLPVWIHSREAAKAQIERLKKLLPEIEVQE